MTHSSTSAARLSKGHFAPRGLSRLLGNDHLAAMVLAKIAGWSKSARKKAFGVTKTDEEWCRDLEVTPKQFRRVKKLLVDLVLVEKTRAPWGNRPNALFLKPTLLAEHILATLPSWAPPPCRNGHTHVAVPGPNGPIKHPVHCLNGPLLYTKETPTKGNQVQGITTGDHADAWSLRDIEELYEQVEQEDIEDKRLVEIDTIPSLIAFWDIAYCKFQETEFSPLWLPGHLRGIEQLVDEEVERSLANVIEAEAESESDAKKHGLDLATEVEDPETYRAEVRPELEEEICRSLVFVIWWAVSSWGEFTDWLTCAVGITDFPEAPEVEFLIYYFSVAYEQASKVRHDNLTDEEFMKDYLYIRRHSFDSMEAKVHEVAAKQNPEYLPVPMTEEQCIAICLAANFSMGLPIGATRYWDQWRKHQGDMDNPKPFSIEAMIEDLPAFDKWEHSLWNEKGEFKIDGENFGQ